MVLACVDAICQLNSQPEAPTMQDLNRSRSRADLN